MIRRNFNRKHEVRTILKGGPLDGKVIYLNPTAGGTIVFTLNGMRGRYTKQLFSTYCEWEKL
jgi:hypothetical protein